MRNHFNKKTSILIIIVLLCFYFFSISLKTKANEIVNEKIYCNATLEDDFSSDRVLVVLNNEASCTSKVYTEKDFNIENCISVEDLTPTEYDPQVENKEYRKVLSLELENSSKSHVLDVIDEIIERDDVLYVGPDYKLSLYSVEPDDYNSFFQWSLEYIDMPDAWEYTTGSKNVIVGVVDTGIDGNHEDLKDSIINNMCRDFSTGEEIVETNPVDYGGHGTKVAGIIGAKGDNGLGITGVNWDVGLVSLRIFDISGDAYSSNLAAAIKYAERVGIPILNLSAGWYPLNDERYDVAVDTIINDYSGLLVCASGNDGIDIDNEMLSYPSSYTLNNIISVGAHDRNNKRSVWNTFRSSNYGINSVDIFAPGGSGNEDNYFKCYTTGLNSTYVYFDGTSCATPHVTGVAALLLSLYPELSAAELKEVIMNGVEMVYDENQSSVFANLCVSGGILNAYQSISSYKTLSNNVETEIINNLNDGKGLFGFQSNDSGFVNISFNAETDNNVFTFTEGSFRLLNEKGEVVQKYEVDEFTEKAINKNGCDSISAYLPTSGYYYIDVDCNVENVSSLKISVECVNTSDYSIDLFNYNTDQNFSINLIEKSKNNDYFKRISINQLSKFCFDMNCSGSYRFVIFKENPVNPVTELELVVNELFEGDKAIEISLSEGIYYIGYFDLLSDDIFDLTIERLVTKSGANNLVTDPNQSMTCGSQITVAERDIEISQRSYCGNTILEGFTRVIYLSDWSSRTNYEWYSSNEDAAIVTDFGTVLAKSVSQDTAVKIMAVNSNDPSIVYVKEFVIRNDVDTYTSKPINISGINMTISDSTITSISFGNVAVPYNFLQYYNWESSNNDFALVDVFGRIYAFGEGINQSVTIVGTYQHNPRVRVYITVNITD